MASDIAALPREPDILIEMVLELRGENGKLRAMLETLRRTLYGARSERFGDDPGQLALGLLEGQLRNVALVLPKDKLKPLRQVPIWLDLDHSKLKSPQYHPSAAWLADHGYPRELARCIHLPDAKYFTRASFQRTQPWGILHELAHAYHDRVLGFNHAEIKDAYQKFVKGGRYKAVLHISGKKLPHYALTNAQVQLFGYDPADPRPRGPDNEELSGAL